MGGGLRTGDQELVLQSLFPVKLALVAARSAPHILNSPSTADIDHSFGDLPKVFTVAADIRRHSKAW